MNTFNNSQLFTNYPRTIYSRVTLLDFAERPRETITGYITNGSINIDGTSSVRRTCSLSIVSDKPVTNSSWFLYTKFKLEVGLSVEDQDPTWFNEGIYVTSSINISKNNISVNGKDKMCMLNGEAGGKIPSIVDFGVEEIAHTDIENPDNSYTEYKHIPIARIIRDAVHHYGGESFSSILLRDIEDYGLELLTYAGSTPMYLFRTLGENKKIEQVTLLETQKIYLEGSETPITLGDLVPSTDTKWGENNNAALIWNDPDKKVSWNATIPFVFDHLLRPREGAGSTDEGYGVVKLALDGPQYTIIRATNDNADSNAGYRYTPLTYPGELVANPGDTVTSILDKIVALLGFYEYFYDVDGNFIFQKRWDYMHETHNAVDYNYYPSLNLSDNSLIVSVSNSPDLSNLKNDYVVWGNRPGVSGGEIPIHMRYVLSRKPIRYTTTEGKTYTIKDGEPGTKVQDWREIIYQMAIDYRKHNIEDDFLIKVAKSNPKDYPTGRTGYESYYVDLEGFWRQVYDNNAFITNLDWRAINFWFDIDESRPELDTLRIGERTEVASENSVSYLLEGSTPEIIYYSSENLYPPIDFVTNPKFPAFGQDYLKVQVPPYCWQYFRVSRSKRSAENFIQEKFFDHTFLPESVSVQAVPIYGLAPNTIISLHNPEVSVEGEYVISKISYALGANAQMSISANKKNEDLNYLGKL